MKTKNKETLATAEQIKLLRQNEINKGSHNVIKGLNKADFLEYYKEVAEKNPNSYYYYSYQYLKVYSGGKLLFHQVTEEMINDYREWLKTANPFNRQKGISNNTASQYLDILSTIINKAVIEKLMVSSPMIYIDKIKKERVKRNS